MRKILLSFFISEGGRMMASTQSRTVAIDVHLPFYLFNSWSCPIFETFFSKTLTKSSDLCQPRIFLGWGYLPLNIIEPHDDCFKPLKYVHDFWIMFASTMCMIFGSCLHQTCAWFLDHVFIKHVYDFWIMFASNVCMISGSCLQQTGAWFLDHVCIKDVHDFWIMFASNMCMISGSCLHQTGA
jgi:uncharacterized Fe-S cluster protein YjdI